MMVVWFSRLCRSQKLDFDDSYMVFSVSEAKVKFFRFRTPDETFE